MYVKYNDYFLYSQTFENERLISYAHNIGILILFIIICNSHNVMDLVSFLGQFLNDYDINIHNSTYIY